MEAGKRTISDIFNGNRVLEIPFFQRSYVWVLTSGNDFLVTWNSLRKIINRIF